VAIGVVEGVVTGLIVVIISRAQSVSTLTGSSGNAALPPVRRHRVVIGILAAAVIIGGLFSWFASSLPDGLEWSVAAVAGEHTLKEPASRIQGVLSFLPDYGFRNTEGGKPATTVAGLAGGGITLAGVLLLGFFLRRRIKRVKR
ncbi:MAG: PDGLE domain-containing protein, partial [Spirochaetales bacterium]|nr:PDGLE domain-containing protein [Spirochaetales bacterium]